MALSMLAVGMTVYLAGGDGAAGRIEEFVQTPVAKLAVVKWTVSGKTSRHRICDLRKNPPGANFRKSIRLSDYKEKP